VTSSLRNQDAIVLACAIWAIHVPLEFWVAGRFLWVALLWGAHGFLLMLALGWAVTRLLKVDSPIVRVAGSVALPVLAAAVQTVLDIATTYWIGDRLLGEIDAPSPLSVLTNDPQFKGAGQMTFVVYLWPFGFYVAALSLLAAARDVFEARLEALRLQVNPHFLFNALNSISAVIVLDRPKQAEEMILTLARFYRGSLMTDETQLAELGDELDALESYVELEQVRLQGAIALAIDCPEALLTARLPSRLLQPLVENAIKHGHVKAGEPFTVQVQVAAEGKELRVAVANPSGAAVSSVDGTGTGLRNVRQRLRTTYGRRAGLSARDEGGFWRISLHLPLEPDILSNSGDSVVA